MPEVGLPLPAVEPCDFEAGEPDEGEPEEPLDPEEGGWDDEVGGDGALGDDAHPAATNTAAATTAAAGNSELVELRIVNTFSSCWLPSPASP